MLSPQFCAGCAPGPVSLECQDSFTRLGIAKVHWECWSDCNMACSFCYRTRGTPLDTDQAKKLLDAVRTGGAKTITFAGGDPSIRTDIGSLIKYAKMHALRVEIQTNSHHLNAGFVAALNDADLVGVSLDGPNSEIHDGLRDKPGNFNRVLRLLQILKESNTPIIVRTIVSRSNYMVIPEIADVLERFPNIIKWSVMEFSPVGEGFSHRERYELDRDIFDEVIKKVEQRFNGPGKLDVYKREFKVGTYALITPGGYLYGTTQATVNGLYPVVGSILKDHLVTLSRRLPFSARNHLYRYKL
jgi:MoaA/NifB/PqqE/SkfB family radical SAM enzyme